MSAAAVISIRRKRLVRAFREAGATDCGRAVTLKQLGQRQSWIFNQMVEHGAFIATEEGRYFLDERAADVFLSARRNRAWIITGVLILVFVVIWLLRLKKK